MSQVTVMIDGKSYRMACEEGQENHLNDLALKFDRYVTHLRSEFGEIGDLRLTVMAGIMVMDELNELQNRLKTIETELDIVKSTHEKLLHDSEKTDANIALVLGNVAGQISNIAKKLNET